MKKTLLFSLFTILSFGVFAQNEQVLNTNDSISKHLFGVRLGVGLDPFIIPNGLIGFYVMPVSKETFRIAIDNLLAVSIPWMLFTQYYYPSVRFYFKHKKVWLGASYGKEFLTGTNLFENAGEEFSRIINHRIDLGILYEINQNFNFEWSIPVRIDDEIPIYITGMNTTLIYKF